MELSVEEEQFIEEYRQDLRNKRNQEKHIVYIERQLNLNSAFTFLQTIFKNTRLITLIGEIHNKSWTCKLPHISISQYCLERVGNNNNCRVMLEYNYSDDPTRMGSEAIRTTYATLDRMAEGKKYIIPFDYRSYFLTPEGQTGLYNYDWRKESLNGYIINDRFIKPYFDKFEGTFSLNQSDYESSIGQYLTGPYIEDITNTFYAINIQVQRKYPVENIQQALKDAWKKVADFFILRELLKNNEINEYIVILGNKHFENLRKVLSNISTEVNYQKGRPENCVKLYHTYTFN